MLLKKLLNIIEKNLPANSALEGDKIGLQIQAGREEVNSLLIAFELNKEVIEEALINKCDCIITFHPLIYSPLSVIVDDNRVGFLTNQLIKNEIALITIHTNFDTYIEGTSFLFANMLGLNIEGFLMPIPNYTNCGMGILAKPDKPLTQKDLLELISKISVSPIRYSIIEDSILIDRIAIVGGSGISFLNNAIESGAQAFITADISYHKFHEVFGKIMLIDPGHYEMEQFVSKGLTKLISNVLLNENKVSILTSHVYTNPVRYFPNNINYEIKQKNYLS